MASNAQQVFMTGHDGVGPAPCWTCTVWENSGVCVCVGGWVGPVKSSVTEQVWQPHRAAPQHLTTVENPPSSPVHGSSPATLVCHEQTGTDRSAAEHSFRNCCRDTHICRLPDPSLYFRRALVVHSRFTALNCWRNLCDLPHLLLPVCVVISLPTSKGSSVVMGKLR